MSSPILISISDIANRRSHSDSFSNNGPLSVKETPLESMSSRRDDSLCFTTPKKTSSGFVNDDWKYGRIPPNKKFSNVINFDVYTYDAPSLPSLLQNDDHTGKDQNSRSPVSLFKLRSSYRVETRENQKVLISNSSDCELKCLAKDDEVFKSWLKHEKQAGYFQKRSLRNPAA